MTKQPMPADWAIDKAWRYQSPGFKCPLNYIKKDPKLYGGIIELARRIESTDEPPLSIEDQAALKALELCGLALRNTQEHSLCLTAIRKYKELIRDQ